MQEKKNSSTVTFSLKGVYEGNTCGAQDVALEYKYVDHNFGPKNETRRAKLNLVYVKRSDVINVGSSLCVSSSSPRPFEATLSTSQYKGIPARSLTQLYQITTNQHPQIKHVLKVEYADEKWTVELK